MRQRRWRQWRGYSGAAAGEQQQGEDSDTAGGSSREVTVELQLGSRSEEKTVILGQVTAAEKIQ
jgi:hypothetical protein